MSATRPSPTSGPVGTSSATIVSLVSYLLSYVAIVDRLEGQGEADLKRSRKTEGFHYLIAQAKRGMGPAHATIDSCQTAITAQVPATNRLRSSSGCSRGPFHDHATITICKSSLEPRPRRKPLVWNCGGGFLVEPCSSSGQVFLNLEVLRPFHSSLEIVPKSICRAWLKSQWHVSFFVH